MWIAHALTALRLPLAIGFWLTYGSPVWSLALTIAAAVSDALDGRVARSARRRLGIVTTHAIGDWLDPLADKVFVSIALGAIVAHDRGAWPLIACLAARELVQAPLVIAFWFAPGDRRVELRAHALGKITTVVQFLAVAAIVAPIAPARWPLAIAGGVLGLATVADQVKRARRPIARTSSPSAARTPELVHDLAPHYPALRAIRKRRELEASPLWAEIRGEVERVLDGLERVDHQQAAASGAPATESLRVVAWNVQRGTELGALCDALTTDPELSRADVWLLSEVDIGMGRSHNRNVPRELAAALGASYAFAVSYLALEDDHLENPDGVDSTLALAGSAIISRVPILRAVSADVPALRDKFESSEKRLGRKRAVVAELATTSGPIVVAQAHLDSNASSAQRALQLAAILDAADSLGGSRLLLGGDLNTTTYNMESPIQLAGDALHKLFVTGFDGTIDNYMTPDRRYELPVFELLTARGLTIEGFNDRSRGTLRYDFSEPYTIAKVQDVVGGMVTRWLTRRLRSRAGVIEARVDWFAGRGLVPIAASVPRPSGPHASDHDPIVVDVRVARS